MKIWNDDTESIFRLIIRVSAYADPTLRNNDSDSSTFGTIAEVNPTGVQWLWPRSGRTALLITVSPNQGKYLSLPSTRHHLTQGQKPEGRLKWG